jgi:hypothetical protein
LREGDKEEETGVEREGIRWVDGVEPAITCMIIPTANSFADSLNKTGEREREQKEGLKNREREREREKKKRSKQCAGWTCGWMHAMQHSAVTRRKEGRAIVKHGERIEREREGYTKKGWKNYCAA